MNPNKDGVAKALTPDVLQQIEATMKRIAKDAVVIYRRNQRPPLLSMKSPARGRLTALGIRAVGDMAVAWKLESRFPQALEAYDSEVQGFLLFKPVEVWDPNDTDQYPINWTQGNRAASLDLRAIMQPRNLEVQPGYVSEIPVSLEKLPSGQVWLFLHTRNAKIRAEGEIEPEEEEDFTATDGDLSGATPAEQAAPSQG